MTGSGGEGGDSFVEFNLADTGDITVSNFLVTAGNGGSALQASGNVFADGGDAGDAEFRLSAESTGSGDVNIGSNVQGGNGGLTTATNGDQGDGGFATSLLEGLSNGGEVTVNSSATSGPGRDNTGFGRVGFGGNAIADAIAVTTQQSATAEASTNSGSGGVAGGLNGVGTATAFADNRFSGTGDGELATATANATGIFGTANSNAVTGNNIFDLTEVVSLAQGEFVRSFSSADIGGNLDSPIVVPGSTVGSNFVGGQLLAAPDSIPGTTTSCFCEPISSLISNLGLNDANDTDSVLAVGRFSGSSFDGVDNSPEAGLVSEANFRIGVDTATADDLLIGFFEGTDN